MAKQFFTLSQLGEHFNESTYRIDYAVKTRGPEPFGRFGIARVWSESDLPAIESR